MELVRLTAPGELQTLSPQRAALHRVAHFLTPLLFEAGNAESLLMRRQLAATDIQSPVFITGLARAGSTLLLEALTASPGTASHRYYDFPWVPAIATRRWFVRRFASSSAATERSHADGLMVTPHSPESFDEMLWRHFFPALQAAHSPLLDDTACNEAFDRFYRNHIKKLVRSEQATRYVAKGNELAGRIGYLLRLFPDAVVVIAVRKPLAHVASLVKQHRWFCEQQGRNPALLEYMNQSGHREFGLGRRAPRLGNEATARAIEDAWQAGDDGSGYALYWNHVYAHLLRWQGHPNIHFMHYEALCEAPQAQLSALWQRCHLPPAPKPPHVAAPSYYRALFSDAERDTVREITQATYNSFR